MCVLGDPEEVSRGIPASPTSPTPAPFNLPVLSTPPYEQHTPSCVFPSSATMSDAHVTKLVEAACLPTLLSSDWGVNMELTDVLAAGSADRCARG